MKTVLNLFFGCRHGRITRPITPVRRPGAPAGETYVACLECGKQFHYDTIEMKMGSAMPMPRIPWEHTQLESYR
jgi:hypothetical protein